MSIPVFAIQLSENQLKTPYTCWNRTFSISTCQTQEDDPFHVGNNLNYADKWMELIVPSTAKVLAWYNHPYWGQYAAVTQNNYGKGLTTYIGCGTSMAITEKILEGALKDAGLWEKDQALSFPLITKSGINQLGKVIHYYFNYSGEQKTFIYPHGKGKALLTDELVAAESQITLPPWGFRIIEEL